MLQLKRINYERALVDSIAFAHNSPTLWNNINKKRKKSYNNNIIDNITCFQWLMNVFPVKKIDPIPPIIETHTLLNEYISHSELLSSIKKCKSDKAVGED